MTTISARTVLRSRNTAMPNKVLSTLLLRYPRWIHAEGRTHRLLDIGEDWGIEVRTPSLMECDDLSRNAASSRAIPVSKMIDDVTSDPAVPLFWGKNVAGMQAPEELPEDLIGIAKNAWHQAMQAAIDHARWLSNLGTREGKDIGAHKQIVNRLLEPFSHITVLVSATEWGNFFALRDHEAAEPHIAMLAREIRRELDRTDNIQPLQPGEWHLPFVTSADIDAARTIVDDPEFDGNWVDLLISLSVARCASTSYKTVDGFDMTLDRAIALHDKLVGSRPIHASPCEHVARADRMRMNGPYMMGWVHPGEHRNFIGFRQYRAQIEAAA